MRRRTAQRSSWSAPPIPVPGGERIKNELFFVEQMQGQLVEHRIDRHSYVIAIGGGAVLDAVGLVAATTHRGIRLIRVPTTVLAQDDSGVGVKNGVNLLGVKNLVGTFAPPFAVLNDIDMLARLPDRDKIAGMAEAVKVALIRDAEFFTWLERHAEDLVTFQRPALARMIRRCAELHMHQIAHGGDPFETGSARPLDYGHWSAHKLETLTKHHVRHGEAVAIGMALDARYSVLAGLLEPGAEERICALLEFLGFRLWHPALESTRPHGELALIGGLREFQEHLGGELTVTLLEDIGRGVEVHEIAGSLGAGFDRLAEAAGPERMKLGGGARAPHLLHQHPPRRDLARGAGHARAHLPAVKARFAPDRPFGVGLRLSAIAAEALRDERAFAQLQGLLRAHDLYVFTINGFPYGPFHGVRVKEEVYQPDWQHEERLVYTDLLADLLADLLPDEPGLEGSVSTVPGTFKPLAGAPGVGRAHRRQHGPPRRPSGAAARSAPGG